MRTAPPLIAALALAGCVTAPPPKPVLIPTVSPPQRPEGLQRVLGSTAAEVTALFGKADQDVREGTARRLQFAGPICILDAYVYGQSGSEAKVTYVDARQPDGRDIDRASCVAALVRRKEAR